MPSREQERAEAVKRYLNAKTDLQDEFQEIVETAANICGSPTALLTLVDKHTQYVKYKKAFDIEKMRREDAFCNYTIAQEGFFVVEDALKDLRFVNNPLVTGEPKIRFYAGVPLKTHDGYNVGSLCVIDQVPQQISLVKLKMLKMLARQIIHLFEFESSLSLLKSQYYEAKKTEVKLRSFFESTTSEHMVIDRDYHILAFNKRAQNFVETEYRKTIEKGMNVLGLIHADYLEEFESDFKRALAGERVRIERQVRFRNNYYWCDITYDPARNLNGEIIGVSYNSTNITERIAQKTNLSLQRAQLIQTAFMQSHELRRPVANIKGLLALLQSDGYTKTYPELLALQETVEELDDKIHMIVGLTHI